MFGSQPPLLLDELLPLVHMQLFPTQNPCPGPPHRFAHEGGSQAPPLDELLPPAHVQLFPRQKPCPGPPHRFAHEVGSQAPPLDELLPPVQTQLLPTQAPCPLQSCTHVMGSQPPPALEDEDDDEPVDVVVDPDELVDVPVPPFPLEEVPPLLDAEAPPAPSHPIQAPRARPFAAHTCTP